MSFRPLLYLQLHRIKNGIARSFKTPVRAAMTVFIAGYVAFSFLALWNAHPPGSKSHQLTLTLGGINPESILTLCHALLLLLVFPPPKYLFTILSEVDVANLYPLPFRHWSVFRFFLFSRSLAIYLLFVCFGALYASMALRTLGPALSLYRSHSPGDLWTILYCGIVVVAVAGLLFWRLLIDILRESRLIPQNAFRITAFLAGGSMVGLLAYRITSSAQTGNGLVEALVGSITVFPFSVVFAPFHFLTQVFLRSADFSSPFALTGLLFWAGLAISGYFFLHTLEPSLYIYAARLASARTEMTKRMRSPSAFLKYKSERGEFVVRLPWFLRLLRVRRAGSIFWRDSIITWRSYGTVIKFLQALLLLAVVAGWIAILHYHVVVTVEKFWAVGSMVLFLPIFPMSMVAIASLAEILRVSDVQKPLPFANRSTVFMHVLQWTAVICSVFVVPYLVGAVLFRQYWSESLFLLGVGCSTAHAFVSAVFLVALFNPDQHDPIQRMYSGLFGFFGMVASVLPGTLTLVLCFVLHTPLVVVFILTVAVNEASAFALQSLSARKYLVFIFTE